MNRHEITENDLAMAYAVGGEETGPPASRIPTSATASPASRTGSMQRSCLPSVGVAATSHPTLPNRP